MNSKSHLIFLFLLLTIGSTHAQLLIGPVVGGQGGWITFSNKDNNDIYKKKPTYGYHAGASISYGIQNNFFLQTSILYYQRGKSLEGIVDPSIKNEVKYNYIDMPIMFTKEFKQTFGKGRFYKLFVGVGPGINYWLGGKGLLHSADLNENAINAPNYDLPYHITFNKAPEDVVQGEMNVESPNRIQLGLNFLGGIIFEPMGFNKFMFTVRYELGHSYLSPDSKGDFGLAGKVYYADDLQVRNQGVSFSLFYFIDLKIEEKSKGKSTLDVNKLKKK